MTTDTSTPPSPSAATTPHRRRPSFLRELRARGGLIGLFGVWALAVALALVLMPGFRDTSAPPAVALVRQFPVLPPDAGRVASVSVTPGQKVRAGDTLAVVEIPGLTQQVAAAAAAVRGLEEELGLEALDLQRKLSKDTDATRARLLSARVGLADAEAELAVVDTELSRYSADGVGAAAGVLESLRLQKNGLQEVIRARKAEIGELKTAWDGSQRRSAEGSSAAFEAQLEAARAEYESLEALKEACVVRAHVDGVVGPAFEQVRGGSPVGNPSFVAEGQWVDRGSPLMTLTEAVTADAVTYVTARAARGIRTGDAAVLVGDSGDEHEAEIVAVGGAVEPMPIRYLLDPAYPEWGVPVTMRLPQPALLPGEQLAVHFLGRSADTPRHNVDVSADTQP